MRYRACPRCQEALPLEEFFCATNPDPMHTPLCSYCLGVSNRTSQVAPAEARQSPNRSAGDLMDSRPNA